MKTFWGVSVVTDFDKSFSDQFALFADSFEFETSAMKRKNEITGTEDKDTLKGTKKGDLITGLGGNDRILVSKGKDDLDGGAGVDTLVAAKFDGGVVVNATATGQSFPSIDPGTVTLEDGTVQSIANIENFIGSAFDDRFFGSADNAVLKGGKGDDQLESSGLNSRIVGGSGNDRLEARGDGSKLVGGKGKDFIDAFTADVTALGGGGADTISMSWDQFTPGLRPTQIIKGGGGNDRLVWLTSDVDRDRFAEGMKVFGGGGADIFDFGFFNSGTIQDFKPGVDRVDLSVHLEDETTSFAELKTMITNTAEGSVLTLDFSTITNFDFHFKGVSKGDFQDGDFIF